MKKKIETGADYHSATAYDRYNMTGHAMDWANEPHPFKVYSSVNSMALPEIRALPEESLWRLSRRENEHGEGTALTMDMLSAIFALTNSFTAKRKNRGGTFYYRAPASAGALYPAELYMCAHDVAGLSSGLYYYNIGDFSLKTLAPGKFGDFVKEAIPRTGDQALSATFYISGIFFRTAWKYRKRAFRYVLLDAGHLLENLLLALKAAGLDLSVHYDFDDKSLNRFMGLDPEREACLACVTVRRPQGAESDDRAEASAEIAERPPEIIEACRVSDNEVFYEEIRQIYQAGLHSTMSESREPGNCRVLEKEPETWLPVPMIEKGETELDYAPSVLRRRSKRNYIPTPFPEDAFMRLLNLVCETANQIDASAHPVAPFLQIGFLADDVEGLAPGFYLLDPSNRRYGLATQGRLTHPMSDACLNQRWLKNSATHFVFMANLPALDKVLGPRSYRYAMIQAGAIGQSIYLGATALGMGCCGIGALYDNEAAMILGLNEKSALLYLVAAGPIKK